MCERTDNWQGMNWIRKDLRLAIYMRDHGRCVYCESSEALTLDHLRPVSRGGGNHPRNLVTACSACNSERGDKPWRKYALTHSKQAVERVERFRRRSVKQLRMAARVALEQATDWPSAVETVCA